MTDEYVGHVEHKGFSHQVIVNSTFCGCSTDLALAERHLQNVLSRLAGRDPLTITMTVEQFFQDYTRRDHDLPSGQRRATRSVTFNGEPFYSLSSSRHQGWFNLFTFNTDQQLSARFCDLVEIKE